MVNLLFIVENLYIVYENLFLSLDSGELKESNDMMKVNHKRLNWKTTTLFCLHPAQITLLHEP